eukprot:g3135.t1 g3135   contig12:1490258-1491796(+)
MTREEARYIREPSDIYDSSEAILRNDDNSDEDVAEHHRSIFEDQPLSESSLVRRYANPSPAEKNNLAVATDNNSITTNAKHNNTAIETILHEYITACNIYGCSRVNAGILTTFRFQLPSLRVSGAFFDSDMLALTEVLLHHANGALSYIKRLDFSLAAKEGKQLGKKGVRSHGAYALSKVLQMSRHIEEVFLPGNKIGPYGASALFCAAKDNATLKTLLLRGCRIGERGAFAFVQNILMPEDGINRCGLREVDLSVNQIGFYGVYAVEKGLRKREEQMKSLHEKEDDGAQLGLVEVDLEGNLILQEVMNCVTHGLGILLAVIATVLLSRRVKEKPKHYVVSCAVYSTSLIVLYMSSTLFHSFFALQRTRYIFQVFDMCAIYILIAGSYTPFLSIVLHHEPLWSNSLLAFIWMCGISGISVEAFAPLWVHKPKFSLAMYLGMGWTCMICINELIEALDKNAIRLLVAGGVWYTAGVPFFVRNNNLDHSIWHCFVMMGSISHWLCIYEYVVTLE